MSDRLDLPAPGAVRWIVRRLEEAGYATWAVGGAVRDALAGGRPEEWDFATAARPRQVMRAFRRTVPVGVEHGTVGVLSRDGRMYEVTTFRRDVETDGRHARVAFSETLEEDLDRRDFTINAVAWHPLTGELRDPHGGRKDLAARLLRTVGDPAERFREDRLRVLRAFRFAGRFGLRIDPPTWEALREAVPHLPDLSPERVREELVKVLAEVERPAGSLRLYAESGALAVLYPELEACRIAPAPAGEGSLWEAVLRTVDALPRARPRLRMAALLHGIGHARPDREAGEPPHRTAAAAGALARGVLQRLRCSNAEVDGTVHLLTHQAPLPPPDAPAPDLRRWLRRVGVGPHRDLLRLAVARCRAVGGCGPEGREVIGLRAALGEVLREAPALAVTDLAIGGGELRALGLAPGPRYGEVLRELLERVTDDPTLNERDRLLEMARELAG